jgi:hypothetical protein
LEDRGGHVLLRGQIGIDSGIRMALYIMCFVCVFFPLLGIFIGQPGVAIDLVAPLVLFAFLDFAYLAGKGDADKIVRNVKRVLNVEDCT